MAQGQRRNCHLRFGTSVTLNTQVNPRGVKSDDLLAVVSNLLTPTISPVLHLTTLDRRRMSSQSGSGLHIEIVSQARHPSQLKA